MSEEINVLEYVRIIYLRWKIVAIFVVAGLIFGTIYAFSKTSLYRAEALIVPQSKEASGIVVPTALSGFIGAMGGGVNISPTSKTEMFLKSRSLAELVVEKFDLIPLLFDFPDGLSLQEREERKKKIPLYKAGLALRGMMRFEEAPAHGTVEIVGVAEDPQLAVNLVNWYIEALRDFINQETMTEARLKRVNLEAQILRNQVEIFEVTKMISEFYELKSISGVDSTVDVTIGSAIVDVPTITVAYGVRDNPGHGNPGGGAGRADRLLVEQKERELAEKTRDIVVKDVPQQAYLEYLTARLGLLRQLQGTLAQQYEGVKVEEASAVPGFTLLDPPTLPSWPWKPNRQMVVSVFLLSSLMASLFIIFTWEYFLGLKRRKS